MRDKRKWATAVHEAGHAIMNGYLRLPMRSVTIVANRQENAAGFAEWDGDVRYPKQDDLTTTSCQELLGMNIATSALAGRAAVEAFCPSHGAEWHYETDERIVVESYGRPNFLDADYRDYMAWRTECLARARRIVREPRVKSTIIALAEVLLRERTVSGTDALRFLVRGKMSVDERRFRCRVLQRDLRRLRRPPGAVGNKNG